MFQNNWFYWVLAGLALIFIIRRLFRPALLPHDPNITRGQHIRTLREYLERTPIGNLTWNADGTEHTEWTYGRIRIRTESSSFGTVGYIDLTSIFYVYEGGSPAPFRLCFDDGTYLGEELYSSEKIPADESEDAKRINDLISQASVEWNLTHKSYVS